MDEVFALFAKLQEELEALQVKNAALEKENAELRARLNASKPEPEALKVYDSADEIVWERGPHTANSYALQQFFGNKHDMRPWKNVIVKGIGQVYWNGSNKQQMDDWYAIAHHRVLDVTADPWVSVIQEGDDAFESDREDMEKLVREYSGGLRQNLSNWSRHQLGAELLQAYLETHDADSPDDLSRPISVTPGY